MSTYAESGVDVNVEEQAAKILYKAAKTTWANRAKALGEIVTPFDDFSGLRAIRVENLPTGTLMNIGFDGVGTKAEFAERSGRYESLAFDLIAMVADDAVIRGGEPVLVGSILDINTLGTDDKRLEIISALAEGYKKAAESARVAVINGEIAQLGSRVAGYGDGFHLSWGASCVWFAHEDRMITGHDVAPGDTIIGLREPGLRSNGISLIRRVLEQKYGAKWHEKSLNGTPIMDLALLPSIIYSAALVDMFGGWNTATPHRAKIHAAAHITGSGLAGKLGRALKPSGLGASIDNPFDPPALMTHVQEIGSVTDEEAYRTWHMGQGMVIITPEPHPVLAVARAHHLEGQVIGTVTKSPQIRVSSRGAFASRSPWLQFTV